MSIKNYKRIVILGSGGSGKTTLSNYINKKIGLPVVYLDKEYWLPNWEKPCEEDWNNKLSKLSENEKWIMDGNYIDSLNIRLERADLVIMLDIKQSVCLTSIFFRTLRSYFVKRKDLSDGCKDKFNQNYTEFVSWVKQFKNVYFPQLVNLCLEYPNIDLKLFTKRRNAKKFIKRMAKNYRYEEN